VHLHTLYAAWSAHKNTIIIQQRGPKYCHKSEDVAERVLPVLTNNLAIFFKSASDPICMLLLTNAFLTFRKFDSLSTNSAIMQLNFPVKINHYVITHTSLNVK